MNDRKLKIITGLLSTILLTSLILKLIHVPGGVILSGLFLGGMLLVAIILACLFVAVALKLVVKEYSFFTLFSVVTAISFMIFHYKLYSPTLKITVPKGFTGEVTLVLSNVDDNILAVDSNGIGYINQWTYDKVYTKPIVVETDGKDINERLVGFNPSTFWSKGKTCCLEGREIFTQSFEIVPINKLGEKQYYSKELTKLVDTTLILTAEPNKYTKVKAQAVEVDPNQK